MQQIVRDRMLIGIDVHKDTHTAVGVSPFGEKLFELTAAARQCDLVHAEVQDGVSVVRISTDKSCHSGSVRRHPLPNY